MVGVGSPTSARPINPVRVPIGHGEVRKPTLRCGSNITPAQRQRWAASATEEAMMRSVTKCEYRLMKIARDRNKDGAVHYTYVLKHEVVLCEDGETVMVYLFFGVTIRTRSMSPTSLEFITTSITRSTNRTSMRVTRSFEVSCNRSIRGWPSAFTECRSLLPRWRRRSVIIQTGVRGRFHQR